MQHQQKVQNFHFKKLSAQKYAPMQKEQLNLTFYVHCELKNTYLKLLKMGSKIIMSFSFAYKYNF